MTDKKMQVKQKHRADYKGVLLFYMLLMAAGLSFTRWHLHVSYSSPDFLASMTPWIAALALLSVTVQLKRKSRWNVFWKQQSHYGTYFIVALPIGLLAIYSIYKCSAELSLITVIAPLLIGVAEEGMYRGILLRSLLCRISINQAIFISALWFSLLHLLNLLGGQSVSAVGIQLLLTFLNGLYFGAIYVQIKKLPLLVLQHGLWDFITFSVAIAQSPWMAVVMAFISVIQLILSIKLMMSYRNRTTEEMLGIYR